MQDEKEQDTITLIFMRLEEMDMKLDALMKARDSQTHFGAGQISPNPVTKPTWPAICVQCGKECKVPFKPFAGSNIRCPECYRKIRGY